MTDLSDDPSRKQNKRFALLLIKAYNGRSMLRDVVRMGASVFQKKGPNEKNTVYYHQPPQIWKPTDNLNCSLFSLVLYVYLYAYSYHADS